MLSVITLFAEHQTKLMIVKEDALMIVIYISEINVISITILKTEADAPLGIDRYLAYAYLRMF